MLAEVKQMNDRIAELEAACRDSMDLLEDMAHAYLDLLNCLSRDASDDPLLARLRHLKRPAGIQ